MGHMGVYSYIYILINWGEPPVAQRPTAFQGLDRMAEAWTFFEAPPFAVRMRWWQACGWVVQLLVLMFG